MRKQTGRMKTERYRLFLIPHMNFNTSHEFLLTKNILPDFSCTVLQCLMILFVIALSQEVSDLDNLVVEHELEIEINRDLLLFYEF